MQRFPGSLGRGTPYAIFCYTGSKQVTQAITLAPTVDAENRRELYQRAGIDKGGIAGDGRDKAEVLGKYQPKSKLENKHTWLFMELKGVGWLAVLMRKGCPSKEGTFPSISKALLSVSEACFTFVCFLWHRFEKVCAN